jgi:predicted DNA-binding protein with PD1-like motif
MKSKLLSENGDRTWAVIFQTGEEFSAGIREFAAGHGLTASSFTAIGAFQEVVLGYFDWETKDYRRIPIREQVEVLSLIGDIAAREGKPQVHAHVVVGKADGTAHGGHLLEGRVRPTLEVILTETPKRLERKHDPESGLALITV